MRVRFGFDTARITGTVLAVVVHFPHEFLLLRDCVCVSGWPVRWNAEGGMVERGRVERATGAQLALSILGTVWFWAGRLDST